MYVATGGPNVKWGVPISNGGGWHHGPPPLATALNVSLLKFTPMLILRRYVLFVLVPAEMEVGVMYLEILQAEFESACKYSGAQLGGLFSRHAKSL